MLNIIENKYKEALINKDKILKITLSSLKADIKNAEIKLRPKSLEEKDILDVIQKKVKQAKESILTFQNGNRQDLIQKEQAQLKILQKFLPEQLTEEEIKYLISKQNTLDIKTLMSYFKENHNGKYDSKVIIEVINKNK